MSARNTLHDLTPPALWRLLHGLRRWTARADWVHLPGAWSAAEGLRGWNTPGVTATYRERWPGWTSQNSASKEETDNG